MIRKMMMSTLKNEYQDYKNKIRTVLIFVKD